ncbi:MULTISPECIES: phage protease [Pseudomonas]|uniref:phage protease n=1 Tax=Pseudomonas TaxID=286 RepID=UPI0005A7F8FF|nr:MULTISPECIES: phage protease [Pseudomonas]AZD92043.1 Phage protein [Pseudomonas chlororaphis subsp. aureofaciens]KAB0531333.1 peptidase [Pseudomonas chlororaphis subsp. aureofaciens]TSD32343.1 peptidase [Pseudomonas sp. ATCC 13985]WDG62917.1 phage protease [Pseudomonas chlororaphis]WDG69184.1 phage protease [Pseudomonas chlororaphis]
MKPLHIFKPGTHTAMSGVSFDFSESDLAATVRAYDPTLHEAPMVIGHPKHDAPAAGWIKSLATTTQGLIAEPQQVDAAFAEQVAKGSYKKISASFYHPNAANNPVPGVYYLRHVGFLGAQPPAVKGLRPIELADGEEGVVEFSDYGHEVSSDMWRRFREWLIGKFDKETADQVAPSWAIDSLSEIARQPESGQQTAFSEPNRSTEVSSMSDQDNTALAAENKRLKADIAKRDKAARIAAQDAIHTSNVEYAEKLVAAGMKPVHAPAVIAALDYAESSETALEFGEDDAREPLSDGLKAIFSDLAGGVSFSEVATKQRAGKTVPETTNPLLADAEARNKR